MRLPAGLPGRLGGAFPLPLLVPSNPDGFPGTGWCNGAEVVYVIDDPNWVPMLLNGSPDSRTGVGAYDRLIGVPALDLCVTAAADI